MKFPCSSGQVIHKISVNWGIKNWFQIISTSLSRQKIGWKWNRITQCEMMSRLIVQNCINSASHENELLASSILEYPHFYRIREKSGSGRSPHRSIENRWRNIDILKGILWRFRFNLKFSKIFWFRDFMSNFRENDSRMFSNEQLGGGGPWTTFLSYSVKVCDILSITCSSQQISKSFYRLSVVEMRSPLRRFL